MSATRPTAYCILVVLPFVLAGCLGDGAVHRGTDGPTPTNDPESTWQAVSAEDVHNMAYQYCAASTPNASCIGGHLGETDPWDPYFQPLGRDARALVVEATWAPSSPLTEEIRLWVAPSRPCNEYCYELTGPVVSTTGTSPLRIEYPEPLGDARDVAFWLRPVDLAPGDPHAEASTEQPVHVRITWEEPA